MLSQCANANCAKPFLRLREGRLFLVETEPAAKDRNLASAPVHSRQPKRHVEHYWLCDECAVQWTLVYDSEQGVALVRLARPVATVNRPAITRAGVA